MNLAISYFPREFTTYSYAILTHKIPSKSVDGSEFKNALFGAHANIRIFLSESSIIIQIMYTH